MPNGDNKPTRPAWWTWISALGILGALFMSGVALYDRIYSAGEKTGATRYQLGKFADLSEVVSQLDNRIQTIEGLAEENRAMLDRRRKEVRKLYSLEATFNAFEAEQRRRDRELADELRNLEQDLRAIAKHVRDGT